MNRLSVQQSPAELCGFRKTFPSLILIPGHARNFRRSQFMQGLVFLLREAFTLPSTILLLVILSLSQDQPHLQFNLSEISVVPDSALP